MLAKTKNKCLCVCVTAAGAEVTPLTAEGRRSSLTDRTK